MSYDHWKTTEPESGYDPPEPSLEEEFDRRAGEYEARLKLLRETAFSIKAERDRYAKALREIARWNGRATGATHMLKTLAKIAADALYPEPACNGGVDLEA